jgi:hypothetical protein
MQTNVCRFRRVYYLGHSPGECAIHRSLQIARSWLKLTDSERCLYIRHISGIWVCATVKQWAHDLQLSTCISCYQRECARPKADGRLPPDRSRTIPQSPFLSRGTMSLLTRTNTYTMACAVRVLHCRSWDHGRAGPEECGDSAQLCADASGGDV